MSNPEITRYRVGDTIITKVPELTSDAVPVVYTARHGGSRDGQLRVIDGSTIAAFAQMK